MPPAFTYIVLVAAVAQSATLPPPVQAPPGTATAVIPRPVITPTLRLDAPAPCLLRGGPPISGVIGEKVIGEKGDQIIGEKVIGEKGVDEKVIGEKGNEVIGEKVIGEKVIGEKGVAPSATLRFGDRWSAGSPRTFKHVIRAPDGNYGITLTGCSSLPAGETVTVRVEDGGLGGWTRTVRGTRNGTSALHTIALPKTGIGTVRLPLVFIIETPPGANSTGYYDVTIAKIGG